MLVGVLISHAQEEPFEVFGFGEVEEHGMISWLRRFADDLDRAVSIGCGIADEVAEPDPVDVVGAAIGGEDTVWGEEFERAQVEFFISLDSAYEGGFIRGEGGRIEDYKIE